MLKLWKAAFIAVLALSFSATGASFVEGKHYVKVEGEQSASPTIVEYFSFYCPACYRQEPFMQKIETFLPQGEKLKKVHVTGMPGRDQKSEEVLTQAYNAAKLLKVEKPFVQALFNAIHVKQQQSFSERDMSALFADLGVESKQFKKAFNSFVVKGNTKKMAKKVKAIRDQGHSAVPTLIINNKYKLNVRSISSMQEYEALVKFLLEKTA